MRITSGIYKGRTLKRVETDRTRETSDKVKQAMFNMLYDVSNKVVLDLFSGSGQLAFEALSRGAKHVIVVDDQKEALLTILDNAMMLGCQKEMTLVEQTITPKTMNTFQEGIDIVIMDPPYHYDQYEELVKSIPLVHDMMIECSKHVNLPSIIGSYALKKEKQYGKKKLYYYQLSATSLD